MLLGGGIGVLVSILIGYVGSCVITVANNSLTFKGAVTMLVGITLVLYALNGVIYSVSNP